ncbi:3-methyladenine DNA glycosylase [Actinokineospora guangxiensis]|uniref:3-methyladenine DNA glycosylase n=1 Tax=Actinokineospora guangxiensis TaxID=1490288 RepID=A0ABW0EKE3_9PSEU
MSAVTEVLGEEVWHARRDAHVAFVRRWTEPHVRRRRLGEKHPVLDFLFTYYSHRPARLERWHPGPGVVLAGESAREYLGWSGYVAVDGGVAVSPAVPDGRLRTAAFVRSLLSATLSRPPRLSCFGLHEWAMVYRDRETRHALPLRLGPEGTDAVVESRPIQCGHFDAFRFFTADAVPLNTLSPTRESQVEVEQPGCLHANMDLFKWAYKLEPYTPSELTAECFALAADVRELDMRASPYDLAGLGYSPVRIETERGRADYVRAQAGFARRAEPLRRGIIALCDSLLAAGS